MRASSRSMWSHIGVSTMPGPYAKTRVVYETHRASRRPSLKRTVHTNSVLGPLFRSGLCETAHGELGGAVGSEVLCRRG